MTEVVDEKYRDNIDMPEFFQRMERLQKARNLDVFVTGWKDGGGLDEAQIVKFDPVSRQEEVLGVLEHPNYRSGATSVCAVEDRVFLVGPTNHVSSFNVATRRPQNVAAMREARRHCAVASSRKELLVCGGSSRGESLATSCEVLHTCRNKWQQMPSLQQARSGFQVVWPPTGYIFIIGGWEGGRNCLNSVEFVNRHWDGCVGATAECWHFAASMLTKRTWFGAVSLWGKGILVAGGYNSTERFLNSAELFAPASERGQWTQVQPMQTAMQISSGVVFDGAVLMFGFGEKENKIQRLKSCADERMDRWKWDKVDAPQSVCSFIRATAFK